jgi:hypothetical protein
MPLSCAAQAQKGYSFGSLSERSRHTVIIVTRRYIRPVSGLTELRVAIRLCDVSVHTSIGPCRDTKQTLSRLLRCTLHFRVGSHSAAQTKSAGDRCSPHSGHEGDQTARPFRAKSDILHRKKTMSFFAVGPSCSRSPPRLSRAAPSDAKDQQRHHALQQIRGKKTGLSAPTSVG